MKTFVVNLAKNKDRMVSIDAQLKSFGIEYERIEAVCGKDLTEEERRSSYSPFRTWCVRGSVLGDGELGCALSHLSIYRKMVAANIERALVIEDDVMLSSCVNSAIDAVEQFLNPEETQVVSFSSAASHDDSHDEPAVFPIASFVCTDMYALTLSTAKEILRANWPVCSPADGWNRWRRQNGLKLFRVVPAVARQDNESFGTDIAPWGVLGAAARKGLPWHRLMWHRCKRLIGIPLDKILSLQHNRG